MDTYDAIFEEQQEPENKQYAPFDKDAWAEKKKAERKLVYDMVDDMTAAMTKDGKALQTCLDVMARFDRYSVSNVFLIAAQKPDAVRLADFEKWKKNNVFIKKGESGILLLEPGEEYTRADGTIGVSYKTKRVFDVSQTSSLQKKSQTVTHDVKLLCRAMIKNAPCPVEISSNVPDDYGAFYNPADKKIYIRQGQDGQLIFRSLAQEIAHAYLSREHGDRAVNLFPAYCAAYILCRRNGIKTDAFSFQALPDSIRSMETSDIRRVFGAARNTANQISADMDRELHPRQREKDHDSR